MSFLDRFRKKEDEEELDILDEIKEPFSFENFIEEQIVGRYHRIRKILDEKGILFFLMSPFQYRNRLLLKLTAIFLGVILGIVPRTTKLINQAQERNAASELAQIEGRSFTIGRMKLSALESSNYKEQHVLTFLIEGETSAGVPSTVENYDIDLSPLRGVTDADKVKYYYEMIPIDNSQRLLLMYVDNREQNDDTGVYGLTIQITGDEEVSSNSPLEIILSNTQETTTLFDANGLDLAILTDVFITKSSSQISDVEKDLEDKLKGFELMADRLRADGYRVATDFEYMESHIEKYKILKGLTDETTVRGIPDKAVKTIEIKGGDKREIELDIDALISIGEKSYSTKAVGESEEELTENDRLAIGELNDLQAQADKVTEVLTILNRLRQQKYDNLIDLQRILNRKIDPEKLSMSGYVEEPKDTDDSDDKIEDEEEEKLEPEELEPEDIPSSGDSKSSSSDSKTQGDEDAPPEGDGEGGDEG